MKKIKFIFLLTALLAGAKLSAQSVDQGKKFFYYQRLNSAKDQFEKVIAANPNNIDAVYWLGQTLIRQKDSLGAKAIYQKALSSNGNAPLLLVGMGQIDLMENRLNEARQKFETAISLTKNKDINVLNAIARANVDAVLGDASYAIEKLNAIDSKKDIRNAETYLLIGDANRKLINGGGAVTAYQKAFSMDPKLAEAHYKIGKVYLTQKNPDYFLPAFTQATTVDPNYAPAYREQFYYWYDRDINKAKDYFNKYLGVSDVDASDEYDRTSIIYASRDYPAAIAAAKEKISQLGDKADPRYYKLIAYSYDELKDSTNAKTYLDQYFAKQKKEDFVPQDYVFRAKVLSKFPGNESEALGSYETAVQLDTAMESKLALMTDASAFAGRIGNRAEQANWLGRIYNTKKDPTNRDLYDWGYANYQAGNFKTADSIFCDVYTQKYPTEVYGYLWCSRAAAAQDTTQEKGTAVEPYKRYIAYMDTARDKYKAQLIQGHGYLASYYANVAKQKDSAIAHLQSILEIDPTNADAPKYIEALRRPAQRQTTTTTTTPKTAPKSPAKAPAKPKTTAKPKGKA